MAEGKPRTQQNPGEELLTLEGAMQFLSVSKPTLYRLLREGKVQGTKVGGQWRFRREELQARMERKAPNVPMAAAQDAISAVAALQEKLGREVALPDAESPEAAEVSRLVNVILSIAIEAGASDIHFEPKAREVLVRQRLDGVLYEVVVLPISLLGPVVNRIKAMADMDVLEQRLPQDGRIHLKYQESQLDVRVASVPSAFGEAVTMRLLAQSSALVGFDRLGFHADDAAKVKQCLHQSNGLIFFTGPTGSGKTTVLYSCLQEISGPTKKTLTIEDPVEYILPHTTQTYVNMKAGLSFVTALRAFLRQDPDIILVGELRDKETVNITLQAALTGHLVLSTMHTNSAASTITRLLDLGIEPFLISAALLAVTAQRLVRCVCPDCKVEAKVEPALMERIRLLSAAGGYEVPHSARFMRGEGCAKCRNTGYRRRMGIYEVLTMNDEIGQAIINRATTDELHDLALRHGMTSLFADGVRKAVEGVTTLEEVTRVCGIV